MISRFNLCLTCWDNRFVASVYGCNLNKIRQVEMLNILTEKVHVR